MIATMAKEMIARDKATSTRENAPGNRASSISLNIGRSDIGLGASGIARQADLFEKIASFQRSDVLLIGVVALIKKQLNRVAAAINGSRTVKCEGRKCFVALAGGQRSVQSRKRLSTGVRNQAACDPLESHVLWELCPFLENNIFPGAGARSSSDVSRKYEEGRISHVCVGKSPSAKPT